MSRLGRLGLLGGLVALAASATARNYLDPDHEQLQAIVDDARGSPDPVIVGGDFNSKGMAEWLAEQGSAPMAAPPAPTSTVPILGAAGGAHACGA